VLRATTTAVLMAAPDRKILLQSMYIVYYLGMASLAEMCRK
jgi:hypothetical protein